VRDITRFGGTGVTMRTLIIDNYDSYTFNLYQMIAQIADEEPLVIHNDQVSWEILNDLDFDNVVISPGPGSPVNEQDFGICRRVLLETDVPLLGVCLGHQGLGCVHGAPVVHAPEPVHGRLSHIYHDGSPLFRGIPQGFRAVRYHSLIVGDHLPDSLQKIAWTDNGLIMALRHRTKPHWGVQFHPESICTEYGVRLLTNFLELSNRRGGRREHSGHARYYSIVPTRESVPSATDPSPVEVCIRKLEIFRDPEQVFVDIFGEQPVAFWLDSSRVEPGLSRFSFMGTDTGDLSEAVKYSVGARNVVVTRHGTTHREDGTIFEYLDRRTKEMHCDLEGCPFDFAGGFVGYFGYELKAHCGANPTHRSELPDAMFLFADRFIAFDLFEKAIFLVCLVKKGHGDTAHRWFDDVEQRLRHLAPLPPPSPTLPGDGRVEFRLNRPYETYIDDIAKCKRCLVDGESYEICLTNKLSADISVEPLALYRNLRRINPAPYAVYLRFGEVAILSSSPERFLRVDRDGWAEAKPIKGTSRRGNDPAEDEILRHALRNGEKDRAENLMIVDLLRNDLGLVCEVGSVCVPKLMDVETYETVHQLVSTVRGKLRVDLGVVDCIRALFPGGSMTGAPKLRTMEIIDGLENEARGVYSGAIGFVALNGTTDLSIVIRTIVATRHSLSIGVGGAIVVQSDAEDEFEEMLLKSRALVRAIALTSRGDQDAATLHTRLDGSTLE